MRRNSNMAVLLSAHNVDHGKKYQWPPEEGGDFGETAAGILGAAHLEHWEKYAAAVMRSHDVDVFPGAAHFLQTCFLCNRRLRPDTDIYMYSDAAFCSAECRGEQIVIDESCSAGMKESLLRLTITKAPRPLCPKNIGHFMEPRSYNDSFACSDYNDNSDATFDGSE